MTSIYQHSSKIHFWREWGHQHSKSMNAFFDHFVFQRNSLVEFYVRFERALEHQRHKELAAHHDTIYTKPQLNLANSLEKHTSGVYTNLNFYLFQEELFRSCIYCGANKIKEDEGISVYIVQDSKVVNNLRSREVVYDASKQIAHCCCKMFVSEGLLCRHILVVLRNIFIDILPVDCLMMMATSCVVLRTKYLDLSYHHCGIFSQSACILLVILVRPSYLQ